jgi:hypothetical protein
MCAGIHGKHSQEVTSMTIYKCENPDCPKPNREFIAGRFQKYCDSKCYQMVLAKVKIRNLETFERLENMEGDPELIHEISRELEKLHITIENFWNKVMSNVSNGVFDVILKEEGITFDGSVEEPRNRRLKQISAARRLFQLCVLELRIKK